MSAFSDAYNSLNHAQRQAVDTTDGPLLIIAGPGTGKTQLLGARVANILRTTDTPASNVLCLTFTENGAVNMRERLTRFIGKQAYDVTISTYHAFGSDLISRYPEYFWDTRLQSPIDELSKRQILLSIVEDMNFKDPLRQTRHHIGDLIGTVSEVKRALLTSDELRKIAKHNTAFMQTANQELATIFTGFNRMPSKLEKAAPYFEQILIALAPLLSISKTIKNFEPLAGLCLSDLKDALTEAQMIDKTKPLTVWKNTWLEKNDQNQFVIAGELANKRIISLADVLEAYQSALAVEGLYDFDDMILRSIEALQTHDDLRYTLHERYLYVLLDEFQDTNAAQLKLVELLTNNPVSAGRPNVLAVGDDDQAIYAFQGAKYSNMIEYFEMYRDTKVINLTENYRSHPDILLTAGNIAEQIDSRLTDRFEGMTKTLTAANHSIPDSHIERREFQSQIAERAWIASEIKRLIDDGAPAHEIAVLAPKHKQLEPIVPYLNSQGIPVRYEKRENILDALVVRQLITMSQLVTALASNNSGLADALWPQVLSYDFWKLSTAAIWQTSWQVADAKRSARTSASGAARPDTSNAGSWSQALLNHKDPGLRRAAEVLLGIAGRIATDNCETILDYLMGSASLESGSHDDGIVSSPLRDYYTSKDMQESRPELFYQTLSHLAVLRHRIREYQDRSDKSLMLSDFLQFIHMYEAAEQPMIDTSPYAQQDDAVQLMTVFKAKGLEYRYVFLPDCLDDTWGSSSRGNSNKIALPANLGPIRHAGANDDERLRILFVAMTRARQGLYLTSSSRNFGGKTTTRLKYLDEQQQMDGNFISAVLPEKSQRVIADDSVAPAAELLELDWRTRHTAGLMDVSLQSLLGDRTEQYQISPTDVLKYIDLEYAGPQRFFFDVILRFPQAPSPDSQFGTAIHETLEWYQLQISQDGYTPQLADCLQTFEERIKAKKLTEQRLKLETERGLAAIQAFIEQKGSMYQPTDVAEKNFRSENVFCGEAHMAGKIDRLEVDIKSRTITVVDYKTGKSQSAWKADAKLHKYAMQLYMYKILIENSKTYAGYTVTAGRLEFIEPDDSGMCKHLELTFDTDETERIRNLIKTVYAKIKAGDYPETNTYQPTLARIKQFEADLLQSET